MTETTTLLPLGTKVTLKRWPKTNWRAHENYGWWVEAHVHYRDIEGNPLDDVDYLLRHPHGGITQASPVEVEPA